MPTKNIPLKEFAANTRKMGVDIMGYNPNDRIYLYKVAKLCAKQAGLPLGITSGVAMSGVGSVTIPVFGAVPGYLAGFLAGAFAGTLTCTMVRLSMKRDLDRLLNDTPSNVKGKVIYDLE
jgi:hypothetical protein